MGDTNFDVLKEGGKSVPSGAEQTHVADVTEVTTAPAAATVGSDIVAFTDPPSAAEMALLRTFVNALKADLAALRTKVGTVVTDVGNSDTKINGILDSLEAFEINAAS
jgi:hypothetical protein